MLQFSDYQKKIGNSVKKDTLIIYGAGTLGKVTLQALRNYNYEADFCDSDNRKHNLKLKKKI